MAIFDGLSLYLIPVVQGVHDAECTCMHSFVLCVLGRVISATAESLNEKRNLHIAANTKTDFNMRVAFCCTLCTCALALKIAA